MKKSASNDQTTLYNALLVQIAEKVDLLEKQQQMHQEHVKCEFTKIVDFEKSAIAQIANSINKMSEKINALTQELEDKNNELNAYREGFHFRISKATFTELIKLYQFSKQDENSNYVGIIEEIFDINGIYPIEAYAGLKFDSKKHTVKGLQITTDEKEDDTIYKVISQGYFVSDHQQYNKVLKYAEVIINKLEGK